MTRMRFLTLGLMLAGAAGASAIVACSPTAADEEATEGESAVGTEDETSDEAFYSRHMTCLHHRRERTRAGGEHLVRAFHLKNQGCLHGEMEINRSLDEQLRAILPNAATAMVGVFDPAKRTVSDKAYDHDVWVRFTNINLKPDTMADLRGLALKVINVNGDALPEGAALNGGTPVRAQDFLMNDINVHFLNAPRDVVRASELTDYARPTPADAPIGLALKTRAVLQVSTPNTLLAREYHSRAPFKLGSHIVRYFMTTCAAAAGETFENVSMKSRDVEATEKLAEDLRTRADSSDGICMALRAQFRSADGAESWLDDYITPWNETPVTLATIRFPRQKIEDNGATCDGLVFNPYYSIKEHAPIGVMNKGRYYIYKASRAASRMREELERFKCEEIFPDFATRKDLVPPTPAPSSSTAPAPSSSSPSPSR